jgi:hypothetical protein
MDDAIPTLEEINVYDSLDERTAVENFLGKDRQEAEALFRKNFLYYQEGLMWMGPRAFCYYLPAALAYVQSQSADIGAVELHVPREVIEFQLDPDENVIAPVFPALRDRINLLLASFERIDDDRVEFDRSVIPRRVAD